MHTVLDKYYVRSGRPSSGPYSQPSAHTTHTAPPLWQLSPAVPCSVLSWPQVLQEAQALEQARKRASEPPDITPFLTQVPVWELKQMRRLCHLTALTYKMGGVT